MPNVDLNAKHYSENSNSQYLQANELLGTLKIKGKFSILDVGCGHGKIIAELSRLASEGLAIGIDPSPNMINMATRTFPKNLYKNLEFHRLNAEQIDSLKASFDLIICTNALMWFKYPKKALDLMSSSLKLNGYLIIFTYDKDTPYTNLFESVLKKFYPEFKNSSAIRTMLSVEQHSKILRKNKLVLEFFNCQEVMFNYKKIEDFKDYIMGWLSCYASIPDDQHDRFLDKIIEEAISSGFQSETHEISIPHKTLSIKACKIC